MTAAAREGKYLHRTDWGVRISGVVIRTWTGTDGVASGTLALMDYIYGRY